MNPQVKYEMSIARIDELQRQAAMSRHAAQAVRGRRWASGVRRWRAGRSARPAVAERYA
jgi:hypothetical protein